MTRAVEDAARAQETPQSAARPPSDSPRRSQSPARSAPLGASRQRPSRRADRPAVAEAGEARSVLPRTSSPRRRAGGSALRSPGRTCAAPACSAHSAPQRSDPGPNEGNSSSCAVAASRRPRRGPGGADRLAGAQSAAARAVAPPSARYAPTRASTPAPWSRAAVERGGTSAAPAQPPCRLRNGRRTVGAHRRRGGSGQRARARCAAALRDGRRAGQRTQLSSCLPRARTGSRLRRRSSALAGAVARALGRSERSPLRMGLTGWQGPCHERQPSATASHAPPRPGTRGASAAAAAAAP